MPKRTNTFQQVVRLVYEHLAAEGVQVAESHMLIDKATGKEREVDVALTSEPVAGVKIVVAIEASDRSRPVDVPYVDGLLRKHGDLPTNKLIIVSNSGFSKDAVKKAQNGNALPVTPEEVKADPQRAVVSRLASVWAKTLAMTPEGFAIWVRGPNGEEQAEIANGDDPLICGSDGTRLSTVSREMGKRLNVDPATLRDELNMQDRTESIEADFRMNMHGWEAEVDRPDGGVKTMDLCLRWEWEDGEVEYRPITRMLVEGRCKIDVIEVSLTHMKLGAAAAAYGKAELSGGEAVLVVTEHEAGNARASLRQPDGGIAELEPDPQLGWERRTPRRCS